MTGRVLVVDDQEPNVRLLELILGKAGYEVRATTDSRQVGALIAEFEPDLVLLDLHMPHVDGFAVLEELGRENDDATFLPVVVLTADADPGAKRRALELGANDFLTKPFDADEVRLRCRNLLATRQLYGALHAGNRQQAEEIMSMASEMDTSRRVRREIVATIERLPPGATLTDQADAFLAQVCSDTNVESALLVAFDDEGTARVVATHGASLMDSQGEESLSFESAAGTRAADGPGGVATWHAPVGDGAGYRAMLLLGTPESNAGNGQAQSLALVTELASTAALTLGPGLRERAAQLRARGEVQNMIRDRSFWPVFQPLVDLRTQAVIGYEALTRFADGTRPDVRFGAAARLGVGVELEEATLREALAASRDLPPQTFLSVNVSPQLLVSEGLLARLLDGHERQIVVEITEHVEIGDYAQIRGALTALGPQVRVAIDDAGAGYASFRHVLELRPNFVKLDAELVRGIGGEASRQALVVGMRYFAGQTGATLIAEGIETEEERQMLEKLEVELGQGYLFGRPERAPNAAS